MKKKQVLTPAGYIVHNESTGKFDHPSKTRKAAIENMKLDVEP